ncbi:MAG: hypothetical protein UY47_C0004G0030 [Parcubacteria group bacterium GW2011_GWB1_49_7]|uniref:Uncharacterized protein n=1 Tax=Candidatus Zambryskibacteria bacterium RIFCSPHIGHO2_01_FULL_46_25 TaxID=1802738 RepID=A0A1G2T0I0_9BACT|nr:MAG: hypothetical protein UX71_C0002G0082 [Parcubacteria group bacterium GW2011_GWA1_47_10]KKW09856.1 MAG: hypothetical protein UY47_C0004G0030 [Parcubacteria group bacterium GW2011_GWB1_49_7]OHA90632.1 MAG: hypothetical protein A2838_02855 [Candidatus Zambryskibacteria bacterium RIFCSPHIGHO2_01_FULL_46_25]OHB07275.1 MAG: hypothetical protein A3A31_01995 [Candidatus Zambryskibacteria bacterium RIFCSPLOWO2_01_FULL_48_25]
MDYFLGFSYAFQYYFGVPVLFVAIPIVTGLLVLVFSKERRIKKAIIFFSVALVISGIMILPGYFADESLRKSQYRAECEEQRQADIERIRIIQQTNPGSIKNVYVPPPCE